MNSPRALHLQCPHCHSPIEVIEAPTLGEVICASCGSTFQATSEISVPETVSCAPANRSFGRFELLRVLGTGAFGTVWKAHDIQLDRIVALKIPRSGNLGTEADRDRFIREARAAAQLRHESIVAVHEVGDHEGQPFIVSDLVEGVNLADWLSAHIPTFRQSAAWTADVSDALQFAHDRGVVHRDIKPSNLMVDAGDRLHVMDFGLAKRDAGEITMTHAGQVLGTPAYMAPEQIEKAHQVDGRADVYALGVVLYRLLTGELPFRGTTRMLLHQVLHDLPKAPRSLNEIIPRDLDTICLKAMAKDPAKRYASAAEFGADLRRFLNGEPIGARRVGTIEKTWSWCKRNPTIAGLTTAVAVVLLVGTVASTYFAIRANQSAHQAISQKRVADRNAAEADARAIGERLAKELARRNLYVAHMQLARTAFKESNLDLLDRVLDLYRQPSSGEEDLRGFEWHYLKQLSHLDLRTMGRDEPETRGYYDPNVAISPDGRRVATASPEGGIRIWEVSTGRVVSSLGDLQADFRGVAFSPDGSKIAGVTCFDSFVHLWDLATGIEISSRKVYSEPEKIGAGGAEVAFSPDGKLLGTLVKSDLVGGYSEVRIWNTETATELFVLKGLGKERMDTMAFSPDGKRLATGSSFSATLQIWDARTGQKIISLPGSSVGAAHSLAFSPDGQRIAAAASDRSVSIWDIGTCKLLVTFRKHTDSVSTVVFSPDGLRLASGGRDQIIRVWEASSGAELLTLSGHSGGVNDGISGLAFCPDGWRLASVSRRGIVKLWDSITSQEAYELPGHSDRLTCVAFSPDGRRLASASLDRTVRIWDAVDGRVVLILRGHPSWVTGVAFSPDGRQISSVDDNGFIKIWDTLTGQELSLFSRHKGRIWGVAFSPDGQRLASAGGDKTVRVWDLTSGKEVWTLVGHKTYVLSVAFSPDGRRLASASWDHTVRVWDQATGKEVFEIKGHTDAVSLVAYSPDGRFIASGSDDRTIRLWHAGTGQEAGILRGHSGIIRGLAFDADGRRLVSASGDNTVKLWDTATSQELLTLAGRSGDWISVAYSPKGSRIALASSLDRKIKVWESTLLTPDVKARREARGLVQFIFGKGLSRNEVVKAIHANTTISDDVRQISLTLADHWLPDVDVEALNNASWAIVSRPDAKSDEYNLALKQAELINQLNPENGAYLNTLGVALYRVGRYSEAADTLQHADRLNRGLPADLAFLSMAKYRLGQKDQAKAIFKNLKQTIENSKGIVDEETQTFLLEAETLFFESKEQPSKQ